MRLDKARYGCVESAALWYDHLSQTLHSMGYKPNPYDKCIYNKTEGGVQCTVAVHVDDLLITSTDENIITALTNSMREKYEEVKAATGPIVNYLGMVLDRSTEGESRITMGGYIEDCSPILYVQYLRTV